MNPSKRNFCKILGAGLGGIPVGFAVAKFGPDALNWMFPKNDKSAEIAKANFDEWYLQRASRTDLLLGSAELQYALNQGDPEQLRILLRSGVSPSFLYDECFINSGGYVGVPPLVLLPRKSDLQETEDYLVATMGRSKLDLNTDYDGSGSVLYKIWNRHSEGKFSVAVNDRPLFAFVKPVQFSRGLSNSGFWSLQGFPNFSSHKEVLTPGMLFDFTNISPGTGSFSILEVSGGENYPFNPDFTGRAEMGYTRLSPLYISDPRLGQIVREEEYDLWQFYSQGVAVLDLEKYRELTVSGM